MSDQEKEAQKPGLTFHFNKGQIILPLDVSGLTAQPAVACLVALYKHMGTITPEMLSLFLKKFRREALINLLRMTDVSGKTAAYLALGKGNNQLYTLLLAKEMGDRF